jgi:hypothetical protein
MGRGLVRGHRSPGGAIGEASFAACHPDRPATRNPNRAEGLPTGRAYTRAMRRWVCIIALLAGFSGQGYAWTIRPRIPAPIERPITSGSSGLRPTVDWWRRP